jgi:uncharacterized tellurite resistance protein B-like protein
MDKTELELRVQGMMGLMEPDYLEGHTEATKIMRSLFIAGAIAMANASDGISEKEKSLLIGFMGEDFSIDALNIEKLLNTLPRRIQSAREHASITQRMQVVRDLSLVARAEGEITDKELLVLCQIADGLEIPRTLITNILERDVELD